MTKSTKQSKVVAVPVDEPDNKVANAVDPVASEYIQVKDQAEQVVKNDDLIEPAQVVVSVGAEPVEKVKKPRSKSKVKTSVDINLLDKNIVMDEKPVEPAKPVEPVMKEKKPRAKSEAKPVKPKKQEQVVEPVVEPIVEESKPKAKSTTKQEIMECKDCGKKLTAKTLKYNHVYNCPAKKQQQQPQKQEQEHPPAQPEQPPQQLVSSVSDRLQKLKQERAFRNHEKVKHLIAQAF